MQVIKPAVSWLLRKLDWLSRSTYEPACESAGSPMPIMPIPMRQTLPISFDVFKYNIAPFLEDADINNLACTSRSLNRTIGRLMLVKLSKINSFRYFLDREYRNYVNNRAGGRHRIAIDLSSYTASASEFENIKEYIRDSIPRIKEDSPFIKNSPAEEELSLVIPATHSEECIIWRILDLTDCDLSKLNGVDTVDLENTSAWPVSCLNKARRLILNGVIIKDGDISALCNTYLLDLRHTLVTNLSSFVRVPILLIDRSNFASRQEYINYRKNKFYNNIQDIVDNQKNNGSNINNQANGVNYIKSILKLDAPILGYSMALILIPMIAVFVFALTLNGLYNNDDDNATNAINH